MIRRFQLDGQIVQILPQDLDGDGQVGHGEVEVLQRGSNDGLTHITEPSELKDMLFELNSDVLDGKTNMSSIDMKARLHFAELPSTLAFDSMVGLDYFGTRHLIVTRLKKRLSVSAGGLGRKENVEAIHRKQEQDAKKGGMMDGIKSFMGFGGGGQ